MAVLTAGVVRADEPAKVQWSDLSLFHDGKGRYLALRQGRSGFAGDRSRVDSTAYLSDGMKFYPFTVWGGTHEPPPGRYHLEFVDHRFAPHGTTDGGGQRTQVIEGDSGSVTLKCGVEELSFVPVNDASRKRLVAKAKLLKDEYPVRHPFRLARDDEGTYYFVDGHPDFYGRKYDKRLFIGRRGKLKPVPLLDVVLDIAGDLYVSKLGSLKFVPTEDKKAVARVEWIPKGKPAIHLTYVDLTWSSTRIFVYTDLGVYLGKKIGTPCDWL